MARFEVHLVVLRRLILTSVIAVAAVIAACSLGSFERITYVNAPEDTLG